MLSRVLEPEVMDRPTEAEDYDAMDHAAVNQVFVEDLLAEAAQAGVALEGPAAEILDVGTGTAQIPILLAQRLPTMRLVAVDLAASMLAVAARNIDASQTAQQICLEQVDAKLMPYAAGRFDAVISNSIVHHIGRPVDVMAEMCRVVRPGGLLFVRDLLRPRDDAEVTSLVNLYAAGANQHQRDMFDASLRAALTLDEVRALVGGLGFEPTSVRQTTDRHWTWNASA